MNDEVMQGRSGTGSFDIRNLAVPRFHFYTDFQRRKRWDAVHRFRFCAVAQCIGLGRPKSSKIGGFRQARSVPFRKVRRLSVHRLALEGRRRRPDKRGKMRRSPSFRPLSAHFGSRQARSPSVSFLHCGAVHRFQDLAQIVVFRFPAQKSGFWPIPANPAESGNGSQCVVLSGLMSSRRGVAGRAVHRFRTQCIGFKMPPPRSASFLRSFSAFRRPPEPLFDDPKRHTAPRFRC